MLNRRRGNSKTRQPQGSYSYIGNNNNEGIASYFDIINSTSWTPYLVWFGIASLITVIVVVVAFVPDYSGGGGNNINPTFTFSSSTAVTTTTSITTIPVTTTPVPALILTCPTTDVQVPLGFPIDNVALGGVSLSGGCTPNSLTFTDTVTGTIARRRRVPFIMHQPPPHTVAVATTAEAVVATTIDHVPYLAGITCGHVVWDRRLKFKTENSEGEEERSPSYPSAQMDVIYSRTIANTVVPQPNFDMDVNVNYVVNVNDAAGGGSVVHVYTKALVELGGSPFFMSSLAPSNVTCKTGGGQGQILYDPGANIWVMLEVASNINATTLCLYASDSAAIITANYMLYQLPFPSLNGMVIQQPKLALFNNYYVLSFLYNETTPRLVLINRQSIITQQASTAFFSVEPALPPVPGLVNGTWTPVTIRSGDPVFSTTVPANITTGVYFMRQRDNNLPGGSGATDAIDLIEYTNINFNLGTANTSSISIPVTSNFDSSGDAFCIPVPGGGNTTLLYAGQRGMSGRVTFNAFSAPYTGQYRMVGTFTSHACSGNSRVNWFELNWNGLQWVLRQEGVTPPLTIGLNAWMPSISEDKYGNILLIYGNTSSTPLGYYPSLGAFSRSADDPLGLMRYATGSLLWGVGTAPSPIQNAWGYNSVAVTDPAQNVGRSFYALGSYSPGIVNVWQGRAAYIRIKGEIVQRNVLGQDVCGQTQTCEFFILIGNV
jgi:hypothetical protein